MGLFLQVLLFPGGSEVLCRSRLQVAAQEKSFALALGRCRWHLYDRGPAVLLNDGCRDCEGLAQSLSSQLPGPVMNLYIYDDDYWGYFLWQGGEELDRFASLPDYFGPGSPPNRPGSVCVIERVFSPARNVSRYLCPWKEEEMGSLAYGYDCSVIGDSWQLADFMGALGYDYALLEPPAEPLPVSPGPRQAAPMIQAELRQEVTRSHSLPADDPELPTALNHRPYALERAAEAESAAPEAVQLVRDMQYQSALPLLSQAIQAHPDKGALYVLRAFCWSRLEGLSGLSRKPDMDRDMTRLLELEPDNIMALRARCPTTGTSSRYQRHIADLTRLMELDPENRDHYQLSRAYRRHWLGEDEAAATDLGEILERGKIWTVDLSYLCRELRLPGF